jgi:hypothetical protein
MAGMNPAFPAINEAARISSRNGRPIASPNANAALFTQLVVKIFRFTAGRRSKAAA